MAVLELARVVVLPTNGLHLLLPKFLSGLEGVARRAGSPDVCAHAVLCVVFRCQTQAHDSSTSVL